MDQEMDLQQFVAETLTQIVKGGRESQSIAKQSGADVNPHLNMSVEHARKQGLLIASGKYAQLVQFDVALTVKAGTGTKGGIGVFVGPVTLGSSGQSNAENSSVSRSNFVRQPLVPENTKEATRQDPKQFRQIGGKINWDAGYEFSGITGSHVTAMPQRSHARHTFRSPVGLDNGNGWNAHRGKAIRYRGRKGSNNCAAQLAGLAFVETGEPTY